MNTQVLVLNADFTPLNVTSLIRGFVLVQKSKAEILASDEKNPIHAGDREFKRPLIIRLFEFINFRRERAKLTRNTIFQRDGHVCQYEGCDNKKNLTVDHIYPKSRGGKNTWKNMVTACSSCNVWKDNKTPEEANMKLKRPPFEPSVSDYLTACNTTVQHAFYRLMDADNY